MKAAEVVKDEKTLASGRLSVNSPFQYGGYTFYQSGYDPRDPDFSSLQVSKDPGVPFVYAGFIILPFGLYLSFYRKTSANGTARKEDINA